MRLLLDENLDWRLRRDLPGHEVESVPLIGWAGLENGELLAQAVETGFHTPARLETWNVGLPSARMSEEPMLFQKLWNYCLILRDHGFSDGECRNCSESSN